VSNGEREKGDDFGLNKVIVQSALALKHFGKQPTIVVNNAGWTYSQKPTMEVTDEEFDQVFNVNVKAIFLSYRVMVPIMKEAGGGSFISISSTAALRPRPKLTWCTSFTSLSSSSGTDSAFPFVMTDNATKGAVSVASKSMALEHAADNIRFNSVCPVAGNTPL